MWPQRVILRNMNRFYSPIGRIRRVDSLSTLLILRLNLFLATHRGKHYTPLFLPHPLRASAETKPDGWGGTLMLRFPVRAFTSPWHDLP